MAPSRQLNESLTEKLLTGMLSLNTTNQPFIKSDCLLGLVIHYENKMVAGLGSVKHVYWRQTVYQMLGSLVRLRSIFQRKMPFFFFLARIQEQI